MTHENYKDLLAAQALTALAAEDARLLNSHVESCVECRAEMGELENVAALLAYDAAPLEPSAQVRERILVSVRAENQLDRSARDRVSTDNVLPFATQPRNVWVPLGSFGAIAATLVFVAMLIALVTLWQKNRNIQIELARLTAEMNETKTQVDRNRAMGELLTSPGGKMAKLAGTNVAPGAQAMLAYDKSGHAMLMAKGLPSAPDGMAYQLWYIKDNKKMPGKVFTPDASGAGMLEDQIPDTAREAAVFAITLEPKAGVQVPTGSIYLLSSS
ncbi:MAG TPA: anti-sigma factor [Pyrinomonadaceae bacterium]|jgi:anti-sigma-K factor RskA|nr:anti-sigma factor [Pyrinomonadaceae bacterium]